jgi:3-oxoacyl-[acyl-carrier protein] reductase
MPELSGKVALVTGSARGIGAAIAKRLARDGAAVMVNYSRSAQAAEEVAGVIRKQGGKAAVARADVGKPEEARGLVERTLKEFGRLDIVVNNAAMITPAPFESVELDSANAQFATNVIGPIAIVKEFMRHVPDDGGRVVNISSLASEYALPNHSVYSATKGALDALTRVWAHELGRLRVTVNAVSPGPVLTDAAAQFLTDEMRAKFVARTPLGRVGESDDIAAVVAFLASSDAGWVTGHVLAASGGFTP